MNQSPRNNKNLAVTNNTFVGFKEVHETTIMEENETVIPSERVSK